MRAPRTSSSRAWRALRSTIRALPLLMGVCWASLALSDTTAIEPFFGEYRGKTISEDDGVTTTRDLGVTIEPDGNHFKITWSTVTRRDDGELKHKSYGISFVPTRRPDIYRSAMRTDMFGNRVPMDPLSGDPFVWCRIAGKTLMVYALLINDDGRYDLQVYDRTLVDRGLDLKFTRHREGDPPKVLSAFLERVADRR